MIFRLSDGWNAVCWLGPCGGETCAGAQRYILRLVNQPLFFVDKRTVTSISKFCHSYSKSHCLPSEWNFDKTHLYNKKLFSSESSLNKGTWDGYTILEESFVPTKAGKRNASEKTRTGWKQRFLILSTHARHLATEAAAGRAALRAQSRRYQPQAPNLSSTSGSDRKFAVRWLKQHSGIAAKTWN